MPGCTWPEQVGCRFGVGTKTLGLFPQTAFCHAWLLSYPLICRRISSYDAPNCRLTSLPLPQVKFVRTPLVPVSRFSSCMLTREPAFQPKLAGLFRSTLLRITGRAPVLA